MTNIRCMTAYRRASGAAAAEVDGQTVIISPVDRRYFALNHTGSRIWELMPATDLIAVDEIVKVLMTEFSVDAERCRTDVEAQIDRLLTAGVVEASSH
jgi:hypothetical protein